jgi:hypothetical protein
MKTKNKKTVRNIVTAAAFAAAFIALQAKAEEPQAAPDQVGAESNASLSLRLSGEWPDKIPKISVTATDDTIADILQNLSKQLGYGLVLKAPEQTAGKKMTLRLVRKPATEVLEIVLENGDLNALLKGGILFVGPQIPAPPSTPEQPTEPGAAPTPTEPPFPAVVPPSVPGVSISASVSTDDDDDEDGRTIKRIAIGTRHEKNRIQVGKSVHIKADEEVDDAVAIGGSLTIEGKVNGDAVAVGGSLVVEPGAEIRGDAVSIGGQLQIKEGAVVHGEQVGVGIPIPIGSLFSEKEDGEIGLALPFALSGLAGTFAAFSFLGFLLRSVLLFVLALVVVLLAPKRVERVRGYLTEHTGRSILAGAVMLFSFVPLIILLAVTIIGLPLIPVAIIALMVLMVVGLAALLTWVGYKIPLFKSRKTQLIALAIGVVLIMLINLIPVAGPLFLFLASFAAAGAALLSKFGAEPKDTIPPAPAEPTAPAAS